MLFVFFSHFVEVFFKRYGLPVNLAYVITQIASPAFICISGVMLGILFSTRLEKYPATKSSFIRRGIFLLTVGRVLIFLAHIPMAGGWREALRWGFMTDAIGVCIIVGPLLMGRVSQFGRAVLGVLVYVFSWVVIFWWMPSQMPLVVVKETLVGSFGSVPRFYTDVFPILPWLGIYLAATSLGEFWGKRINQGNPDRIESMSLHLGLAGVASAIALVAVRFLLETGFTGFVSPDVHMLMSPQQKLSPGFVYFLFYGGGTFLLIFVLMRFRRVRAVERLSAALEVLGRNSLFAFIAQYFVYFALFPVLTFPSASVWPALFAVSALVIWGLAYAWDKAKLNRYLTVPKLRAG